MSKTEKKNKVKMSLKEKLVFSSFMSVCPKIIDMWKSSNSNVGFDEWLLNIVENYKKGV